MAPGLASREYGGQSVPSNRSLPKRKKRTLIRPRLKDIPSEILDKTDANSGDRKWGGNLYTGFYPNRIKSPKKQNEMGSKKKENSNITLLSRFFLLNLNLDLEEFCQAGREGFMSDVRSHWHLRIQSVIQFTMIPLNSNPRDNQSADHWTLTVSTLRALHSIATGIGVCS
ncbi:hypothetical protein M0804_002483 [Polistes exclamans]|nr:hypothetical protein M0804_002483 [Polistes exclamans]